MMRLLFVTPAFPPFTGGGERYAQALAETLAGRGHAVTVVTSDARHEQDFWQPPRPVRPVARHQEGQLVVWRCPLNGWPGGRRGLLAWRKVMVMLSMMPGDHSRRLARMARRVPPIHALEATLAGLETPDAILGFNLSWEYTALAGREYARRRGLPFVLIPFAHLGDGQHRRVGRNNTMDHQRQLLESADAVLVLTQAEVDGFLTWGIRPGQITILGGGVEPAPPLPDPAGVLTRFRLQSPYALFVGRVNFDKGAIHAAQAVLALNQAGLPVTLALVGRPATDFSRFFNALSPAEREIIRPLGVLSEEEKHSLLQSATALLLPSRTDSFGIVLLEAWLHATPVIGARVGGVGSVIQDGQDGLLVPFGDVPALAEALGRLVTDADLNQRLGTTGQERVQSEFTWARVADKVEATLTALQPSTRHRPVASPEPPRPFVAS